MRRRLRTQKTVYIARPLPVTDALGGVAEGYAAQRLTYPAYAAPLSGLLAEKEAGCVWQERRALYLARDADIRERDGVWLDAVSAQPDFRCVRVERYPLHIRATVERRRP